MKKVILITLLICLVALPLVAAPQGGWEIVRADYGWGNNWTDVTDRVRSLVQGDSLNFRVDGYTLGADQRRGRNRTLRLELKARNGSTSQLTFRDSQLVNLQINPYQSRDLRITRAIYGVGNRTADVTSRLNSQIQNNRLDLQVTNLNMGGDPAPNKHKTLTVEYFSNGRNERAVVTENDTLRLFSGDNPRNNLQITRAVYGNGYRTADVTSRLNSQVRGDQLDMSVNNGTMGGDPAPDQAKTLTVDYTMNGQTQQVVLREGDTLRLPNGNSYGNNNGGDYNDDDYNNGSNNNGSNNNGSTQLTQRVVCESLQYDGNRRKYCAANTSGGVRLSHVIGDSRCDQGSSWGYDNGGVWVDRGCRAEFEMRGNGRRSSISTSGTIPSGTEISVRTNDVIDSKKSAPGQNFAGVIAADVLDTNGGVMIPKGSDAELTIRSEDGGGINSASELVLDINSITLNGNKYFVSTDDLTQKGGQGVGANRKTAIMVGGGAGIGTLLGAIVGGGKGAAIGAAIGAGAGAGTQIITKGRQVRVPSETVLNFKLDQDLSLQGIRN